MGLVVLSVLGRALTILLKTAARLQSRRTRDVPAGGVRDERHRDVFALRSRSVPT